MLFHHRYRVLTQVSSGNQAKVYLVFDETRKLHQILKVYESGRDVGAFLLRQIENVKALSHPQILVPHSLVQDNPVATVSNVVKGVTLWERAREKGGLDFQTAGIFLAQIANIFDYLNQKQVVHRDLKPQNIIVDHQNVVYLIDFDAAFFKRPKLPGMRRTAFFRRMGTSQYMSPEHLRGEAPRAAMDVYAAAVSFYQIMSLRFPFGDQLQSREDIANFQPVEFLTKYQNGVLKRSLDPNPAHRLPSVLELYKELYRL